MRSLVGRVVVAHWLPWGWRLLRFARCEEVNDADDANDGGLHLLCACFRDGKALISAFFQRFCPVFWRSYPYSRSSHRDRGEHCNPLLFAGVPACDMARGSEPQMGETVFGGESDSFGPVYPFAERRATMGWGLAEASSIGALGSGHTGTHREGSWAGRSILREHALHRLRRELPQAGPRNAGEGFVPLTLMGKGRASNIQNELLGGGARAELF